MSSKDYIIFFCFIGTLILIIVISCHKNNDYSYPNNSISREIRINYPDSGRYIKYFDADWKITHYKSMASFYRNAYYKNGVIVVDSLATDYYITGEKQGEAHIFTESPDKCDGKMLVFYKNGKLKTEAHYKYGIPIGVHTDYYETGKLMSKSYFKNGNPNGTWRGYYENGKNKYKVSFLNGEKHGTCYFFYENGNTMEVVTYNNGILNGAYKGYYESGQLKCTGTYKNGKESGVWFFYNERGICTTKDYDYRPINNFTQQTFRKRKSSSPRDAYDEGYNSGYEQGYEDGSRGRDFEYGYDDSSNYYEHYEAQYQDGYRNGYEDGYSSGKSRYEDENDEDE